MTGSSFESGKLQLHPGTFRYSRAWSLAADGTVELAQEQQPLARLFQALCREYEHPFIIDVGSHVGTLPLVVSQNRDITGWLFEPHATACELLHHNIAANGLSNRFQVFQKAISHFPGRRILKSPANDKDSGLSCIGQPNYSPSTEQYVDVVKLDDLACDARLESIDIINVDTEGSELFVLIGATETINRHKPDILLKVNWGNLNQSDVYINNLTDYLELLGYRGHWVGPEDMLFRHPYRHQKNGKKLFAGPSDSGGLKIAILKQHYDVFGPWRSEKYDPQQPLNVLRKWPSKHCYHEMTHLFQADWFVLPFCHDSKIVRQKIDYHQHTFDENSEFLSCEGRHFDNYDVIISLDPILRPPQAGSAVYAYFQNEHHYSEYSHSLSAPLPGYDLFLDHMMNAPLWVYDIPQSVSFPYPRDPFRCRQICRVEQTDATWFDKRFVMMLTHGNEAFHRGGFEATVAFLEKKFRTRVVFTNLDFEDMTNWGDPIEYMREMSSCSYYVNLIACGAGQGLCDAASLGLICFGSARLPYHRAVCHPVCLCQDLTELEWKLAMVRNSADLQEEIRCWQDTALSDMMVKQPIRLLQAAVEMKRQRPAKTGKAPQGLLCTTLAVEELPERVDYINSVKLRQLAQAEHEKGNYAEAIHRYKQALWFDRSDHELFYQLAVAYYAAGDYKNAFVSLTDCLKINGQFRPALTLQAILQCECQDSIAHYAKCRDRVLYLIQNRFNGFDKITDGGNLAIYNLILDELLQQHINNRDIMNQLLVQHHKLRLNSIAGL